MSRVLVIGASSFVGSHICRGLRDEYEVIGTYYRHRLKIDGVIPLRISLDPVSADSSIVQTVQVIRPRVVVYCAAVIDDQEIQRNPNQAIYVNKEAPRLIATELKRTEGKFIYLSTSKVFSGNHEGFYKEADAPRPGGTYGATKRQAEIGLDGIGQVYILRLGTVFGLGSFGQSSDLFSRILRRLWSNQSQPLIFDEYRSFFPADAIATAVKTLIRTSTVSSGLFHLAGPDRDSYYSFAKALALTCGLPYESLVPVKGETFHGPLSASGGYRGTDLSLNGTSFADTFNVRWESLLQSLTRMRGCLLNGF